jgi:hypothetical protein
VGGLTYLFGFTINAVIATIIAVPIAVLVAALVRRRRLSNGEEERVGGTLVATFAVIWLSIMAYGCVDMFRTHHIELDAAEGASKVPGLVDSTDDVLRAERIADGDTAQTYILVKTSPSNVENVAQQMKLHGNAFDAHTARERGWTVPEWWPSKPCRKGVTYDGDFPENVVNWCPTEGRAYIQHFDY